MARVSPHYLFMALEEHPYAREMLSQLLRAGLPPALIIEEASDVATEEREKFLNRIAGNPLAPTIAEQAEAEGIEVLSVPAHRDEHCMPVIRRVAPDLIVLGGTRIIRGEMLASAKDGMLNAHPGLLPECRGSASPAWSVLHDIPIGSSCHFCSEGIDEGDLVGRREVPVHPGDTYEDLCYRTLVMSGTLMAEAVSAYAEGRLDELRQPQGESPHPTFKNMPDDLLERVHEKLRKRTYRHYSH